MFKIYVSPSVQEKNIGYGSYGSEEYRMNLIADWVIKYLSSQPDFECRRNDPSWNITQIADDSDKWGAVRHLAIHSDANAKPEVQGTTAYYADGYEDSKRYATAIYNAIAPLSPGADKGVKADTVLYDTGLGELRATKATAALVEMGYHTNPEESADIMNRAQAYGKGLAKATVEDCGRKFIDPDQIDWQKEIDNANARALVAERALQELTDKVTNAKSAYKTYINFMEG